MDWAYIFVVVLSILLAIFLIVAGVLVVMFIRVTKQIQQLTGSAQKTAHVMQRAARQLRAGTQLVGILSVLKHKLSKRRKETNEGA